MQRAANTHLEGSQSQFKHQSLLLVHVFGWEGEDGVVDAEKGDEQEGGARQTPTHTHTHFNKTEAQLNLNSSVGPKDVMQEQS